MRVDLCKRKGGTKIRLVCPRRSKSRGHNPEDEVLKGVHTGVTSPIKLDYFHVSLM